MTFYGLQAEALMGAHAYEEAYNLVLAKGLAEYGGRGKSASILDYRCAAQRLRCLLHPVAICVAGKSALTTGRTTASVHQRARRCRLGLSNGLYRITSADKKAREAKIAEAKERIFAPPTVIVKKEDPEDSSLPAAGAAGAGARIKSEPGSSKASACAATPAIKSEFGDGDVGDVGTPASSRSKDGDDDVADGVVKDEPGPCWGCSGGGAAATQQGGAAGGAGAGGMDFGAEDDGGGGAGDSGAALANIHCCSLV